MRKLTLFGAVAISMFGSCTKSGVEPSHPPIVQPKPTITLTASPNSPIGYGDSVTVSYTSTNANGASGSIKLRLLRDTTISRTVVGPGGSATGSISLTVAPPDAKTVMLTGVGWKLTSMKYYKTSNNTWQSYVLDPCQQATSRTFYLNFKEYNDHLCFPSAPEGYGWADWFWKTGPVSNRDSLSWGTSVYGLLELSANKLVIRQNTMNIPGPGTTLVEWTYSR